MGLASGPHTGFLLGIEVEGLPQPEDAFATLSRADDEDERRCRLPHQVIGRAEIGLCRPRPDPARRERIALI